MVSSSKSALRAMKYVVKTATPYRLYSLVLQAFAFCRCIFLCLRFSVCSVGCRSPPHDLDFQNSNRNGGKYHGWKPSETKEGQIQSLYHRHDRGRPPLADLFGRKGNRHHFEISAAVFALFDSFELDDLSYLNEVDRHYEQSELTEASLYDRAVHRPATVEESALQSMEYAQLHRAISELPEIQKRRLILYYFQGLTYEQIAGMEGCTFQAVAKSVAAAEKRLKNFFGIGG